MTDVLVAWDADLGAADLVIDGADLAADDGLATAVILSLFTDRRVAEDELPPFETARRGWWGDSLAEDGDEIGSKLWLLAREKRTPAVLVRAEEYAGEALAWLADDDLARAVSVSAAWTGGGWLCLSVAVDLGEGSAREYQFQDVLRAA